MSAAKDKDRDTLERLLEMRFAAHPWHGVPIGDGAPEEVMVYVEIVPTDSVKYELDKATGHLPHRPTPALLQLLPDAVRLPSADLLRRERGRALCRAHRPQPRGRRR